MFSSGFHQVLAHTFARDARARFVWASAVAVSLALLALGFGIQAWRTLAMAQGATTQAAAVRLEWTRLNVPEVQAPSASAPQHAVLALPVHAEADQVVQRMEQAARPARVVIRRIEITQVPPSTAELGRLQLAVVAEGGYADLKRWMAEWSARLPAATISQLRLQRPDSAPGVAPVLEWSGTVTVWSRPLAPGP